MGNCLLNTFGEQKRRAAPQRKPQKSLKEIRITLLGSAGAGKTSLWLQFFHNSFDCVAQGDFSKKPLSYGPHSVCGWPQKTLNIDGERTQVKILDHYHGSIWDSRPRELSQNLEKTDGFVLVFDVSSSVALEDMKLELEKLKKTMRTMGINNYNQIKKRLVILGNKADTAERIRRWRGVRDLMEEIFQSNALVREMLEYCAFQPDVKKFLMTDPIDVARYMKNKGLDYFEVSAATGQNVRDAMAHALQKFKAARANPWAPVANVIAPTPYRNEQLPSYNEIMQIMQEQMKEVQMMQEQMKGIPDTQHIQHLRNAGFTVFELKSENLRGPATEVPKSAPKRRKCKFDPPSDAHGSGRSALESPNESKPSPWRGQARTYFQNGNSIGFPSLV